MAPRRAAVNLVKGRSRGKQVAARLFQRPVRQDEPSRSEESLCGFELEGAAVQAVCPFSPIPLLSHTSA